MIEEIRIEEKVENMSVDSSSCTAIIAAENCSSIVGGVVGNGEDEYSFKG